MRKGDVGGWGGEWRQSLPPTAQAGLVRVGGFPAGGGSRVMVGSSVRLGGG